MYEGVWKVYEGVSRCIKVNESVSRWMKVYEGV